MSSFRTGSRVPCEIGVYPTPPAVVEAVLDWLLPQVAAGSRVLEGHVGTGAWLTPLWERRPDLRVEVMDVDAFASGYDLAEVLGYQGTAPAPSDDIVDAGFLITPPAERPDWILGNPPYNVTILHPRRSQAEAVEVLLSGGAALTRAELREVAEEAGLLGGPERRKLPRGLNQVRGIEDFRAGLALLAAEIPNPSTEPAVRREVISVLERQLRHALALARVGVAWVLPIGVLGSAGRVPLHREGLLDAARVLVPRPPFAYEATDSADSIIAVWRVGRDPTLPAALHPPLVWRDLV